MPQIVFHLAGIAKPVCMFLSSERELRRDLNESRIIRFRNSPKVQIVDISVYSSCCIELWVVQCIERLFTSGAGTRPLSAPHLPGAKLTGSLATI
jgi:hypothetical protein